MKPWPWYWPTHCITNVPCDMAVGPCACGGWHEEEEFDYYNGELYRFDEVVADNRTWKYARTIVNRYLNLKGQDLCHENRRDLAEAFDLVVPDTERVTYGSFCTGCDRYQRLMYGWCRSWTLYLIILILLVTLLWTLIT